MTTYTFDSKIHSRRDVILGLLPPPERQYWALCAKQVDDGQLILNSELDQLLKAGFLQSHQFHGVDYDSGIIEANEQLAMGTRWFCGDMRDVLASAHEEGWLNPSIVNVDLVWATDRSLTYARRILTLLRPYSDLHVVVNFCQEVRSHRSTKEEVEAILKEKMVFELEHWRLHPESYTYPGRNRLTTMRSFIFHK